MSADFVKHRDEAATFRLDASQQITAEDSIQSPSVTIRRDLDDQETSDFDADVQWDGDNLTVVVTLQEQGGEGEQPAGRYEILAKAQRNNEPWVFMTQDFRTGEWRLPNFDVIP